MSTDQALSSFYLYVSYEEASPFTPTGSTEQEEPLDTTDLNPQFGDKAIEEACPWLHSRSGSSDKAGVTAISGLGLGVPLSLWGLLSLSHLSVPLRGRESHPRDPS